MTLTVRRRARVDDRATGGEHLHARGFTCTVAAGDLHVGADADTEEFVVATLASRALFGALLTAGVVYVLVGIASAVALPTSELQESSGPLLAVVEAEGLQNIRVYDDDATQLLDWLPEGQIDQIDLLYADPWPKKRHWKRRFVSQVNLDRFHKVLKPEGIFCFASDIDTYVNWTLQHCRDHGGFEWTARNATDWLTPYDGWPGTRYEAKARREGRSSAYLTFRKR